MLWKVLDEVWIEVIVVHDDGVFILIFSRLAVALIDFPDNCTW